MGSRTEPEAQAKTDYYRRSPPIEPEAQARENESPAAFCPRLRFGLKVASDSESLRAQLRGIPIVNPCKFMAYWDYWIARHARLTGFADMLYLHARRGY